MYWSMSAPCSILEDVACGVIHALSAAEARAHFRLLGESRVMDRQLSGKGVA